MVGRTVTHSYSGLAKRRFPGLVNSVAVAYHSCLALPEAFTQLRAHLSWSMPTWEMDGEEEEVEGDRGAEAVHRHGQGAAAAHAAAHASTAAATAVI